MHLAHDHVHLGLTDLAGNVLAERSAELNVDHQPTEALAYTAVAALDLIGRAGLKPDAIAGLGVALSASYVVGHRRDSRRADIAGLAGH